jgi:hypothetical protein
MNLEDHPTARRLSDQVQGVENQDPAEKVLKRAWLRHLALDCGADDAGLVEIARPGLDPQREEILRNYPWTKSLLNLVVRMAREPVRGTPRSVANLEFHRVKGNPRLLLAFGKCFPSAGARHRRVEILPQPSKLRREPSHYQKNDPATGKIRWSGRLALAEVEEVTHNVKTFRFRPLDGRQIPFDYFTGQFAA